MVGLVLLVLAFVTLITFFLFSRRRHNLFKQLNIPGPEPTRFLGILPQIKEKGVAKTDLELIAKYGQNVGVFVGHRPVLLTSDADVIQEVCVKKFQCFRNRAVRDDCVNYWYVSIQRNSRVNLVNTSI